MPFDDRTFPSHEAASFRRSRRRVAFWLFAVAFMIWGMVVIGGATRLTGSGLSIMEWAPFSGALPPVSDREWNRLFTLYKTIPQYTLLHPGMGLAEFRGLFWLEWLHRAWGRLIGVVFVVPLIWFALRGELERRFLPRLVLLFGLGALQGAVGWFMVASGFFPDSISVSPYRLVVHLTLALCLFAAILWTAMSTLAPVPMSVPGGRTLRRLSIALLCLVSATIAAGGFTAGLHAGLVYNTFPLMDGKLFPEGYASLSPFLANLTESVIAVQFNHRLLASLTALTALGTVTYGLLAVPTENLTGAARLALMTLGLVVLTQYSLGVLTLLSQVHLPLAIAHQAISVVLLATVLALAHALRGAR